MSFVNKLEGQSYHGYHCFYMAIIAIMHNFHRYCMTIKAMTGGDMTWSKELLPKLYKTRLRIHPKIKLKITQIVTRAMGGWPDPPGRPGWPDWPDKYSHQIEYERGGVRSVKHANLLIFSFDQSARHIQSSVQEMLAHLKKTVQCFKMDTFLTLLTV